MERLISAKVSVRREREIIVKPVAESTGVVFSLRGLVVIFRPRTGHLQVRPGEDASALAVFIAAQEREATFVDVTSSVHLASQTCDVLRLSSDYLGVSPSALLIWRSGLHEVEHVLRVRDWRTSEYRLSSAEEWLAKRYAINDLVIAGSHSEVSDAH